MSYGSAVDDAYVTERQQRGVASNTCQEEVGHEHRLPGYLRPDPGGLIVLLVLLFSDDVGELGFVLDDIFARPTQ